MHKSFYFDVPSSTVVLLHLKFKISTTTTTKSTFDAFPNYNNQIPVRTTDVAACSIFEKSNALVED